jgi:hypothetical protein
MLNKLFHTLCSTVFSILALSRGNPVHLIWTKGARQVWKVSRGCLLPHGTYSYRCICRRSVLPYTWFCFCLCDYDHVLHIVYLAILYYLQMSLTECEVPLILIYGAQEKKPGKHSLRCQHHRRSLGPTSNPVSNSICC